MLICVRKYAFFQIISVAILTSTSKVTKACLMKNEHCVHNFERR